ncbi:MAG: carbohydrate kinase family protein [Chloroflexi bacterium]|nr:carbohydrate kinase family protein [Chloroflexota bacterium]
MYQAAPNYLLLGELRREFILTADGRAHLDRLGGNALYAAGGLGIWAATDEGIGLVARVGEDYPRDWLEVIRSRGLDISGVRVLADPLDLRLFVAYGEANARHLDNPVGHFARLDISFPRALLGYDPTALADQRAEGAPSTSLRSGDLPDSYRHAAAAHLCPMDLMTHSLMPAELRRAGVSLVTLDPGSGYMRPEHLSKIQALLPGLTAFLPGEEDLQELFRGKTRDVWEMVEGMAAYGCEFIIVKTGERGQLLFDCAAKARFEIPAYPNRVLDPTGAGDAFAGGFLAGLKQTHDSVQAALYGSVAASFAVEGIGPFFPMDVLPGLQQARLEALAGMARRI